MKFKSKIDLLMYIILAITLVTTIGFTVVFTVYDAFIVLRIICLFAMSVISILSISVWVNTYYILEENELLIKRGFFSLRIPYKTITSVKPTKSLVTGTTMGLSLDKLEIKYSHRHNDMIYISPKNKEEFINQLNVRAGL